MLSQQFSQRGMSGLLANRLIFLAAFKKQCSRSSTFIDDFCPRGHKTIMLMGIQTSKSTSKHTQSKKKPRTENNHKQRKNKTEIYVVPT